MMDHQRQDSDASDSQDVLCFQCGQDIGDPPVLNKMPDGKNCSRCAERVLEALPSIRPSEMESVQTAQRPENELA